MRDLFRRVSLLACCVPLLFRCCSAAVPLLFCHVPPLSRCLPAVVVVLFCRVPPPGLQLFCCCSVVVLLRYASFCRYSVVLLCLSGSYRVLPLAA